MEAVTDDRPLEQAELDRTVAGITGALPGSFETARSVLFSMMGNQTYGRPLDYDASEAERVRALKIRDLQERADAVVDPGSLVWVVVGDASVIGPQLEGLDLGPVETRQASGESSD